MKYLKAKRKIYTLNISLKFNENGRSFLIRTKEIITLLQYKTKKKKGRNKNKTNNIFIFRSENKRKKTNI